MICNWCHCRYADFPSSDYYFIKNGIYGIYPKTDSSCRRREIIFDNDDIGECGCHLEYENEKRN